MNSQQSSSSWIRGAYNVAAIIATLLLPSSVHGQCNQASEAQLKISYTIDQNTFNSILPGEDESYIEPPFLTVRPSGNTGSSTMQSRVDYESHADVVDFELCIARANSCIEVVVAMFPPTTYEISWDGQVIEKGLDFPYWKEYSIVSTEMGNACTPTCDVNTEALFEYNHWTGGIGLTPYRVEDSGGNTILGCDTDCQLGLYFSLFKHRECLPRNTCFQFLTGSKNQWIGKYHANAPYISVEFDGELVDISESWLFKSINFGGNNNCFYSCDEVSESLVEFFMTKDASCDISATAGSEQLFNWVLSSVSSGGAQTLIERGIVRGCATLCEFE